MNDQTKTDEPTETGTALVERRPILAGGSIKAIIPQSFGDICRLAAVIAESGLAPKDFKTPQAISIAIMHGMEIGLPPMQALQRIAVINGRPCLWGDAALALVRASGLCEYIKEWSDGSGENYVAYCESQRRGDKFSIKTSYSVSDAKVAGLWGKRGAQGQPTPWVTNPKRMMQMRARGFNLRDGYPDVLGGLYLAEELQDGESMKDVTPITPPKIPTETARSGPTIEGATASSIAQADEAGTVPLDAQPPAPSATPNPIEAEPALAKVFRHLGVGLYAEPDLGHIPPGLDRRKKKLAPEPTSGPVEPFSNEEEDAYLSDLEVRFDTAPTYGDLQAVLSEHLQFGVPRMFPPSVPKARVLYDKAAERFET